VNIYFDFFHATFFMQHQGIICRSRLPTTAINANFTAVSLVGDCISHTPHQGFIVFSTYLYLCTKYSCIYGSCSIGVRRSGQLGGGLSTERDGLRPDHFYIQIGMQDEEGFIDCPSEEDIEIVSYIAKKYGCRFEVVSLHEEYWNSVVKYTIDSVKRGLTPNPDMMCNKLIKFGVFEQKWGHQFDKIATGHYATTTELDGLICYRQPRIM